MLESYSDFVAALREVSEEDILNFTRKYVIHGTPYIFKDKENEYYDFRKRISEKWNVSFHEVFITGSAKLGYSYELLRNYKHLRNEWFDFFKSISNGKSEVGNYKVTAGVYKSYKHLENYVFYGVRDKYSMIKLETIK